MAATGVTQISIPSFMGINQSTENMSMQYATYAENVDTSEGRWRTAKGAEYYRAPALTFVDNTRIDKIIRYEIKDFFVPGSYQWYVFYGGKIYSSIEWPENTQTPAGYNDFGVWEELSFLNGQAFTYITNEPIDCVFYQDTNGGIDLYDVVIFSGKKTGCFEIFDLLSPSRRIAPLGYSDAERYDHTTAKYHFSSLCQYKERIFGVGKTDDKTWDRIYYSQPFKPNDWEQIAGNPEESGGIIDYPTWDDDEFVSLVPFGGYLVAFKRKHAIIISGAYPGEFNVTESYGTEGVVADGTVQVGDGIIFFLSDHGIGIFDGNMIRNVSRDVIGDIVGNIDFTRTSTFSSNYYNGVYSVSVRTIEAPTAGHNIRSEVIEYDYSRGTFMLRTGVYLNTFCNSIDKGVFVACTGIPVEGVNCACIGLWNKGDCYFEDNKYINALWISPWTDCGHKESMKSGFRLRCQCERPGLVYALPGILRFTVETERKQKTKWLESAMASASKRKMIAKNVSNRGRQFRFIMENRDERSSPTFYFPLQIDTGLQIEVELDSD